MADVSGIQPDMKVSFELHTNVISNKYKNVVVVSIANYFMARTFEDIDAIHANIYSTLPKGTPKSPQEYNYLIVRMMDGEFKAVGIPWIKDPIEIITNSTVVATIENVTIDDAEKIRSALNAYGYGDIRIEVK